MNNRQKAKHFKRLYEQAAGKMRKVPVFEEKAEIVRLVAYQLVDGWALIDYQEEVMRELACSIGQKVLEEAEITVMESPVFAKKKVMIEISVIRRKKHESDRSIK